jgi:hypothetical protein
LEPVVKAELEQLEPAPPKYASGRTTFWVAAPFTMGTVLRVVVTGVHGNPV